jgi:hypothetical protein
MSIECTGFKSHQSGALQGFANFIVPKMGIELFGCGVFMKNGKRFLTMPSREFNDPETGEKKYIKIMKFIESAHNEAFCKSALQALDAWCAAQEAPSAPEPVAVDEPLPF